MSIMDPGGVIAWIFVGLVSGALAGRVVEGRGFGCLGDILVGIAGAFVGGIIFSALMPGHYGFFGSIVVAFIGAVLLLAVVRALAGGRR